MRILVDCDGVLSDFVSEVLRFDGYAHARSSITDFNIFRAWGQPDRWPAFNTFISQQHRVLGMLTEPGSEEFVKALRQLGEVAVCTSPYKGAPFWIPERLEWLERHFGFKPDDVCVWSRKHWVQADVLIDDALHNALAYPGRVLLLDQPWNQGELPLHVTRCFGLTGVIAELSVVGSTENN